MRLHKTDTGNPWMSDIHTADTQERIESIYTNEMHTQTYKPGQIHSAQGSRATEIFVSTVTNRIIMVLAQPGLKLIM